MWYDQFNGAFWISLATLTFGAIAVCVRASLASKCSNTNICFGCIKIERDVYVEEDIELAVMNRPGVENIV